MAISVGRVCLVDLLIGVPELAKSDKAALNGFGMNKAQDTVRS